MSESQVPHPPFSLPCSSLTCPPAPLLPSSSWLELKLAWAKNFKRGWLGSAWWQSQNLSRAWLELKIVSESYKLSFARAQGEVNILSVTQLDLFGSIRTKFSNCYPNLSSLNTLVLLWPVFTNLCNFDVLQTVGTSLKLKPGQAKKSELGWLWLGLLTNSKSEPELARAWK